TLRPPPTPTLFPYTTLFRSAMGYIVWMPVQEPGSWISEGDSPTFLNLLDNGLRADEDSAFGGWGGRAGVDIGPEGPSSQYPSARSEEHTSELQSRENLVCRL